MAEGILSDIVVRNHRSGQKVGFYFYSKVGGLQYIEKDVPYVYCSKRLSPTDISKIKQRIDTDPTFREFQTKIVKGGFKDVLRVFGERGKMDSLNKASGNIFKRVSTNQEILAVYPLLSNMDLQNFKVGRDASLEELLDLPLLTFDLELRKTKKDGEYDQIFLCGIGSMKNFGAEEEKTLIVLENYAPEKIDGVRLIKVKDQEEFGKALMAEIEKVQPFTLAGQNLMNFDLMRLRELSRLQAPKIRSLNKFSKEVVIPGYQVADTFRFAQMWLSLPKNNLETLCNFYDIPFEKDRGYEEIQALTDNPTPEGNLGNARYCMDDIGAQLALTKKMLEPIARIALTYGENFAKVSTQKGGLAKKLRDKEWFDKFGNQRYDKSMDLKNFDYYGSLNAFYENFGKGFGNKRGIFENVKIVKPLLGFNHLALRKRPEIEKLKELALTDPDFRNKIIYSRAVDIYCEEPLLDLLDVDLHSDESPFKELSEKMLVKKTFSAPFYRKKYGFAPGLLLYNLLDEVKETDLSKMINYSNDLFFVPADVELPKEHFLEICKADKVISAGRGRVVAKIGNKIITPGVDLYGRHGLRTNFEKETIAEFARIAFEEGKWPALFYLNKQTMLLNQGKISEEKLNYKIKRYKDVYSYRAHNTRRYKMIKEKSLQTGEQAKYSYDTIEAYKDIFFGERSTRGRLLSKGTISDFVFSVVKNENEGRKVLNDILEGKSPRIDDWCENG